MHDIHRTFPVLLGIKLMHAMPIIKSRGFIPRICKTDNVTNELGDTFVPLRINLSISQGIITGYTFY
jgi:hypothetical protein